jgi:hypothetical protein
MPRFCCTHSWAVHATIRKFEKKAFIYKHPGRPYINLSPLRTPEKRKFDARLDLREVNELRFSRVVPV